MNPLVGRDHERAAIREFVDVAAHRPAVAVIEGEAGIGKTVLVNHGIDIARASGVTVVRTSPSEQDAVLTFAGLTDLLSSIDDRRLDELPPPQRDALAAATLRARSIGTAADDRAIRTGLATLLAALATDGPVLVAIDDVQWLDAASAAACAFALRRVAGPVGLLVGRRTPSAANEILDAVPPDVPQTSLELRGLSLGGTFVLVRETLGMALPRIRLNRIWEASEGNPLYALELARATRDRDIADVVPMDVPIPQRLHHLLTRRVGKLTPFGREACIVAACATRLLSEQARLLGVEDGTSEAIRAGVLMLDSGRITFTHPLLANASAALATEPERARVHARLAEIADDPEARARHLALADPLPSEAAAAALDDACRAAQARGSLTSALELARLAFDRTPACESSGLARRRLLLGTLLFRAGETGAAEALLSHGELWCPAGAPRAEVELVRTDLLFQMGRDAESIEAGRTAIAHAGDDAELRARALLTLGTVDAARHTPYAAQAKACLEAQPEASPLLLAWATIAQVGHQCLAGEGVDRTELDRAMELERSVGHWRSDFQVATVYPVILRWIDEYEASLDALAELERAAAEQGDDSITPYILGHRASALIASSRFTEAAAVAREHLAHAEATGQTGQRLQALQMSAYAAVFIGEVERARTEAREVLAAVESPLSWTAAGLHGIFGLAELWQGRPDTAREHFACWRAAADACRVAEPGVWRFHADEVEALLACGDVDAAVVATESLRASADRAKRRSAQAFAHRCDAMISAHRGELRGTLDHLDRHLACVPPAVNDYERARAMLLRGTVHRRLKEKAAARAALESARDLFASTGAASWRAVADGELARIGQRSGDPFTLTETERRVAELVALGLTNREVAERAFMSAKTVEANLAKIYRKLGIRSRAELGARMSQAAPAVM